jgi:hypothetical protein
LPIVVSIKVQMHLWEERPSKVKRISTVVTSETTGRAAFV